MMVGGETTYKVQKGDNLLIIGARNGVFWKNIAADNNINVDRQAPLTEGTELKINTRRIVPRTLRNGIIINIPDRTLYLFRDGTPTLFPVAVGSPTTNDGWDWRTPIGKFVIVSKRRNPTWHVPLTILRENRSKGIELEETMEPGPNNPLGSFAVQTSIPGLLIHSTIAPASVYRYASHGCLRMLPEHMEQFYPAVEKGLQGEIIYEPVKLAVTETGRIYLEVRSDVYNQRQSIKDEVFRTIGSKGLSYKVDWMRINRVIRDQTGVAEDITLLRTRSKAVAAAVGPAKAPDTRIALW
jgi:L,D-transpeptidase ErfK/SrfK